MKNLSIAEIAEIAWNDWKNPYFGAKPYLSAMFSLGDINDDYGLDTGKSVVMYFLANAGTWRGEVAREVKKELNRRLKS